MTDPQSSTESTAGREGCSVRKINKTISLAFLAPHLVKADIDRRARRYCAANRGQARLPRRKNFLQKIVLFHLLKSQLYRHIRPLINKAA
jgi:hypothetical protein